MVDEPLEKEGSWVWIKSGPKIKRLEPTTPATRALTKPTALRQLNAKEQIGPTLYCKYRDWASLTLAFNRICQIRVCETRERTCFT